jgi:DNA polymerase III psi subunit
MVDFRQVSLLSEMGIPVWQLRQKVIIDEASKTRIYEEVDNNPLLARIESAKWLICHDRENTQQTQRLIQSILLAMNIALTDTCSLTPAELKALEPETIINAENKQLWVFGESIIKQLFGDAASVEQLRHEPQFALSSKLTTLVSLDLASLLSIPEAKKQLWQDLRHLRHTA